MWTSITINQATHCFDTRFTKENIGYCPSFCRNSNSEIHMSMFTRLNYLHGLKPRRMLTKFTHSRTKRTTYASLTYMCSFFSAFIFRRYRPQSRGGLAYSAATFAVSLRCRGVGHLSSHPSAQCSIIAHSYEKYLCLENTLCSVRSCFCGFKVVPVHSSAPVPNPG